METNRKALLKKIAESAVSSGGNNIRDGRGRLIIKRLALESGFKGQRFVAEFAVQSSQKIPVSSIKTSQRLEIEPNEPGSDVSWVQLFDEHPNALGNVKGFILALYGETEEPGIDDFVEVLDAVTSKNSAVGMAIDYETFRKVTKKNEIEIVVPKWFAVQQTDKDIAKSKSWLESLTMGSPEAERPEAHA